MGGSSGTAAIRQALEYGHRQGWSPHCETLWDRALDALAALEARHLVQGAFSEGQRLYWQEEAERHRRAVERLASYEGFEGALDLKHAGPDALARELRARIMFAEGELA